MIQRHASSDERSASVSTTNRLRLRQVGVAAAVVLVVASLVATPVAADGEKEKNPMCGTVISGVFNFLIQFSVWIGGAGGFATVMLTKALESLPYLGQEQRKLLKNTRGRSIRAGLTVFLAGPAFTIFVDMTGVPIASCIKLVPF
ncbi:hypothetical protein [Halorussus caseinilyticus]|uniref:Uncharacterized protein n=1 Tax=Halorussus caseinilyticus TaxID=3034025 RepID=A0ABD5WFD6_9EURY|nr:hypothetical protein [Halorussus sp. DT72]